MSDNNPDEVFPFYPSCYRNNISHGNNIFDKNNTPDEKDTSDGTNISDGIKKNDVNNPEGKPSGLSTSVWKYVIAGVISGIFIATFLWVADRIGSMWGGIIASIPVSLIVAIVFIRADRLHTFTFALILGTIAYLVAAVTFFVLCTSTGLNKWACLVIALILWIIVIGFLFCSYRKDLKDKDN